MSDAAEARRLADLATGTARQIELRNGTMSVAQELEALTIATAAQAHATLALVEQQRIANLIALAGYTHSRWANYSGAGGGMGTLWLYPRDVGGDMRLVPEIAEALGIEQEEESDG